MSNGNTSRGIQQSEPKWVSHAKVLIAMNNVWMEQANKPNLTLTERIVLGFLDLDMNQAAVRVAYLKLLASTGTVAYELLDQAVAEAAIGQFDGFQPRDYATFPQPYEHVIWAALERAGYTYEIPGMDHELNILINDHGRQTFQYSTGRWNTKGQSLFGTQ